MQQQPSGDGVYLKLVTANVLRLRRQFDLAEAQCSDVLRHNPTSAEAHSVMGDIARDRGDLRDAMEWYKLALDLDPDNLSDRKKLEAVIDRVYPREKVGPVEKLRESVSGQLGRASQEMRAARLPAGVYVALGAVLAVIVGITVVVLVIGSKAAPPVSPAVVSQPSGGFVAGPVEPRPEMSRVASADKAEMRFAEQVAPLEADLLTRLQQRARLVDPNCQVQDAEIDPRDGVVAVRISMPRVWSAEQTRNSILAAAESLAVETFRWDSRVAKVRVRSDMRQRGQPDQRAFVGEAEAEALAAVSPDPSAQPPEQLFSDQWWEPQLLAAVEPAGPSGVQ
ncbi:MAG: tetratricopeptide repeat protein [Armatimonadota bacterium]